MAVLNLTGGNLHSFGNSTGDSIDISTSNDGNVLIYATVDGGVWKSWDVSAPAFLNGFSTLDSGYGYAISTSGDTAVTLPDSALSLQSSPVQVGLNFLSVDQTYPAEACPKWTASIYASIDAGVWKSWDAAAPAFLNGFSTLDVDKGYVALVSEVFDIAAATSLTVGEFIPFASSFGYSVENISEVDAVGIDMGLRYALEGMSSLI